LLPSTPNEQDGVFAGEHTRVAGTVSEDVPVTVFVLPSHCQLRHSTVTVADAEYEYGAVERVAA
jgi:hypothetical protein